MGKKIKTLCKSKELAEEDNISELREIVGKPAFFCKKCLRVASKSDYLCKSRKLKGKSNSDNE